MNKIKRYEELQAIIKTATNELNTLKNEFIQSNGYENDTHIVFIKDNFRESVASKAIFEKKFGSSWLKDNDLLTLSAFSTIAIALKSARKAG